MLPIILYHYPFSPYARRIVWYLRLRGIPYLQCIQPPLLPRPDLTTHLAVTYRRIPLLSIGRDVYLDTRLILKKLESLFPLGTADGDGNGTNIGNGQVKPRLGAAKDTPALALERLFSVLTTSTDLFFSAAALLPESLPLLGDKRFQRDREDFFYGGKQQHQGDEGRGKEKEVERAEALREVRDAMALVEGSVLGDGREWILGGDQPSLADIEAIWVFHWMIGLPGALDKEHVNAERFPRVYSWVERFQRAVERAKETCQVKTVSGEEAAGIIKGEGTGSFEAEAEVDGSEPIVKVYGLEKGQRVEVWPTDSGVGHRDRGRLVGLGADEVVWETDAGVRVHAPRHGFRVRPVSESGTSGRGANL